MMTALTTTDTLLERLYLIPDELVELAQWIVWRDEIGVKVPYSPVRPGKAKVNDPATWGTFHQAVDAFADALGKPMQLTGIGYVFSDTDPYIGVDLDDCVSGDIIHPAARKIIDSLGGYAEVSPSGTGVKSWTRGRLTIDSTGKKTRGPWGGDIEIYHRGRWFAVTGRRIDR